MSYDQKCYDLAVHFLSTELGRCNALAQEIQDAIENFIESHRPEDVLPYECVCLVKPVGTEHHQATW